MSEVSDAAKALDVAAQCQEAVVDLRDGLVKLENAIRAYATAATTGPHAARDALLEALNR